MSTSEMSAAGWSATTLHGVMDGWGLIDVEAAFRGTCFVYDRAIVCFWEIGEEEKVALAAAALVALVGVIV
jgi:hypothetical protein